jgi:hypothetical protein
MMERKCRFYFYTTNLVFFAIVNMWGTFYQSSLLCSTTKSFDTEQDFQAKESIRRFCLDMDYRAPLKVGSVFAHGETHEDVLVQIPLIRHMLEHVSGRRLQALPGRSGANLSMADIVIGGPYSDPDYVSSILLTEADHAILIFVDNENMQNDVFGPVGKAPHDGLTGVVDASFTHTRHCVHNTTGLPEGGVVAYRGACAAEQSQRHVWSPWWLQFIVNPTSCTFFEQFTRRSDPQEWINRPRFASLFSAHEKYPRELLFHLFQEIGEKLDKNITNNANIELRGTSSRTVYAPGKAFHNFNLSEDSIHSTFGGVNAAILSESKLSFSRSCRFSVTPENSRSWSGGYTTEKIAVAHLNGQVPVYWGDDIDTRVWNPRRILFLDDAPGKLLPRSPSNASLISNVIKLETDEEYRRSFFAESILAPNATRWLKQWCAQSKQVLRAGLRRAGKI